MSTGPVCLWRVLVLIWKFTSEKKIVLVAVFLVKVWVHNLGQGWFSKNTTLEDRYSPPPAIRIQLHQPSGKWCCDVLLVFFVAWISDLAMVNTSDFGLASFGNLNSRKFSLLLRESPFHHLKVPWGLRTNSFIIPFTMTSWPTYWKENSNLLYMMLNTIDLKAKPRITFSWKWFLMAIFQSTPTGFYILRGIPILGHNRIGNYMCHKKSSSLPDLQFRRHSWQPSTYLYGDGWNQIAVRCHSEEETHLHILLTCPFSPQVWQIINWCNSTYFNPPDIESIITPSFDGNWDTKQKWNFLPFIILWMMWNERKPNFCTSY